MVLCMTRRLNVLNKCMKFRRNISNGNQFIERAGFCDGQTDTSGKQYISPDHSRGRHNNTLNETKKRAHFSQMSELKQTPS